MDQYERELQAKGFTHVVGIDEAGRGPLAGPVVAAAVHIPYNVTIDRIDDSKKLTSKKRKEIYNALVSHDKVLIGVGQLEADAIDSINILQATLKAMQMAIDALPIPPDFALIDGNKKPETTCRSAAIIGGDRTSRLIGAASIVAKHIRDEIMLEYHKEWPEYEFAAHKGYGTKKHIEAMKKYGVLPIHRATFAPVKIALAEQQGSQNPGLSEELVFSSRAQEK